MSHQLEMSFHCIFFAVSTLSPFPPHQSKYSSRAKLSWWLLRASRFIWLVNPNPNPKSELDEEEARRAAHEEDRGCEAAAGEKGGQIDERRGGASPLLLHCRRRRKEYEASLIFHVIRV